MKVVYISNYMNHHQLPLCKALYRLLGEDFMFISIREMSAERKALGYSDMDSLYPFVRKLSKDDLSFEALMDACNQCDILLVGSAEDFYFTPRLHQGKIVMKCSERYFKQGNGLRQFPKNLMTSIRHIRKYQKHPLYYLCASAFTARDVNAYANYSGRTFKWGYFPEVFPQEDIGKLQKLKTPRSVLWVARMLDWKHPEAMIYVAKRLRQDGISCRIEMIGNGPLLDQIQETVNQEGLGDFLFLRGAMPAEKVREQFDKSMIFVMTSDQNEGWGAVLNEAMSSACAVVASDATGSAPYLVSHKKNGFLFESGNWEQMYQQIKELLQNESICANFGSGAYKTMMDRWNGDMAADRLIRLCTCILAGGDPGKLFAEGPCSPA